MGDSNNVSSGQMSLFDALGIPDNLGESTSAQEIADVIKKLQKAQQAAQIREEKEGRKREREEARRKAREEKERKEAHIREVTSMDLPLDWNNIFDSDPRSEGVHVESIPDALIMSLTALGTAAYLEVKGAIDQFDGKLKGWLGFFDAAIIEPQRFEDENEFKIKNQLVVVVQISR